MTREQSSGVIERNGAYATFMYQTGIALELVEDGAGFMWVTGNGMDEVVAVSESDGDPSPLPPGSFGDLLVSHNHVVMDRNELPAFREGI